MSKFTCTILCAVAVILSSVSSDGVDSCREGFKPLEQACLKELGFSNDDLDAAMKAHDVALMDSCFWGCLFKKLGILNDKGQYDLNTGLTGLRKVATSDLQYAKLEDTAKQCETVKDKAVSDGDAGCERGALVAACFIKLAQ